MIDLSASSLLSSWSLTSLSTFGSALITSTSVPGSSVAILDDGPDWVGPFTEYDKYGDATGHTFVRCPECGVEVLESDTATASHRPACRFE